MSVSSGKAIIGCNMHV